MAIDKNSNAYTFGFAILMVIVVGSLLAIASQGLKTRQDKNATDKKMMSILSAINIDATRENAKELYNKYVIDSKIIAGKDLSAEAFNVDIKKEFRNKNITITDRNYPLYICEKDGDKYYIIPVIGTGLWGPIWGFVALESDYNTIYGATFDHKTETPGLGADIKEDFFEKQFAGKKIFKDGKYVSVDVMKGGAPAGNEHGVDAITGGTITSVGVANMLQNKLEVYAKYFKTQS